MILRSTFLYAVLPVYGVVLALSVRAARRRRTGPQGAPSGDAPFLWLYLRNCAAFPLLCLALIALIGVFPGRLP
ncbi:hypothetical protein ACFWXK_22745 [Streptomyces sp. NPDC059070]|uniref:hypothetical protein n=1 Tax=unclassified Streptomyces TaxID=2593676 RepID=UPI0034E22CF6